MRTQNPKSPKSNYPLKTKNKENPERIIKQTVKKMKKETCLTANSSPESRFMPI